MPGDAAECPVCGLRGVAAWRDGSRDVFSYECLRCGRFAITRTLAHRPEWYVEDKAHLRPYLSAHTRQAWKRGQVVELHTSNWEAFAALHARSGVDRKIDLAFDLVADGSRAIGDSIKVNSDLDYPLFDAKSRVEADKLLQYLSDSSLISTISHTHDWQWLVELTMSGWRRLEERVQLGMESKNCFVAMWFTDEMFQVFDEAIDPAVRAAGFNPILVNRIPHNDKVCDKIIAEIRQARFVVADFTGDRGGAYFEAGFAMGLGRPVIFTCRKDHMEKVHFDTNHYNHITWETAEDLKTQLEERILATIVDTMSRD